ncbi:MAG: TIGR02186 family protein [Bacillota bacterium]
MPRIRRGTGITLALVLILICPWPAPAGALTVRVAPELVSVNLGYHGREVLLEGEAPPGADVYVKVVSAPVRATLSQKGRVLGFWMNVRKVSVEGLPKLYQLYTPGTLADAPPVLRREGFTADYADARRAARVTEQTGNADRLLPTAAADPFVASLVQMYERKGLYAIGERAVQTRNGRFRVLINVPVGVPQGEIRAQVYAVRAGHLVAVSQTGFRVRSAGLVRQLRVLSGTDGPVYGSLAVLIALFAGALIGIFFDWLRRFLARGGTGNATIEAH